MHVVRIRGEPSHLIGAHCDRSRAGRYRPVTFTTWTGRHGTAIITLGGELDILSAPTVREHLLGLVCPGAGHLVINLSAIRYADASGLAALVSTQRRAALLGGAMRLAAFAADTVRVIVATEVAARGPPGFRARRGR
jgi:anti-anti-sigma factor